MHTLKPAEAKFYTCSRTLPFSYEPSSLSHFEQCSLSLHNAFYYIRISIINVITLPATILQWTLFTLKSLALVRPYLLHKRFCGVPYLLKKILSSLVFTVECFATEVRNVCRLNWCLQFNIHVINGSSELRKRCSSINFSWVVKIRTVGQGKSKLVGQYQHVNYILKNTFWTSNFYAADVEKLDTRNKLGRTMVWLWFVPSQFKSSSLLFFLVWLE